MYIWRVWIDARKLPDTLDYMWNSTSLGAYVSRVERTPFGDLDWSPGYPHGTDCLTLVHANDGMRWRDAFCDLPLPYACEIPIGNKNAKALRVHSVIY